MSSPVLGPGTRWAIDAVTALRVVREDPGLGGRRPLVGPSVLRSHALSILYGGVRRGVLDEATARAHPDGVATLKMRVLGDRGARAGARRGRGGLSGPGAAVA